MLSKFHSLRSFVLKNNLIFLNRNCNVLSPINFLHKSSIVLNDDRPNDTKSTDAPFSNKSDHKLDTSNKSEKLSQKSNGFQTVQTTTDLNEKLKIYFKNYNKQEGFNWIQFYKFNHIKTASMLTKAKFYQSGLVVYYFFYSLNNYLLGETELSDLTMMNTMTFASLLFLVFVGQLSSRVVGIAYYEPDKANLIRIAHLTFFGRRNNLVIDLKDISPLSDTNDSVDLLFHKLVINIDGKEKIFFLANDKFSTLDHEVYKRIFGTIK